MTQTTTSTKPPPEAVTAPNIRLRPFDLLMNLIAALLAPMFLCVTGGDVTLARMAALETVNAYRARDLSDLIAIAQIIAYGLASLSSLSQSMEDDIPLSMTLRLRGNANALNRSAEQNRRAIRDNRGDDPAPRRALAPEAPEIPTVIAEDDSQTPADGLMDDKVAKMLADEASARLLRRAEQPVDRAPAPVPAPPAAPATAHPVSEKRNQEMWAIVMAKESSEIAASIPGLPPTERNAATIRAGMLSSTANQLLMGARAPMAGVSIKVRPTDGRPAVTPTPK
jgi:hypothetical protein